MQVDPYPRLSLLSWIILLMSATSEPSERIFSVAGLTTTVKRSTLQWHHHLSVRSFLFKRTLNKFRGRINCLINACEMWIWRKMQRISWMEKKTNEEVRLKIGVENDETLQQMAIRRKLGLFGHIMRSKGLEKEMMMACRKGRRKRGRPRKNGWMKYMKEL